MVGFNLNLNNFALTQYSNLDFDSVGYLNNKPIGGNSSGLFELCHCSNDNGVPILAQFAFPITDFNNLQQKKLRSLYIDGIFEHYGLRLTVDFDHGDIAQYDPWNFKTPDFREHSIKYKTGLGLSGKFIQIKFENINGSDFELNGVYLTIMFARTHP